MDFDGFVCEWSSESVTVNKRLIDALMSVTYLLPLRSV